MRTGLGFRYMVITNDNMVYTTDSNVQIFIIGGLLNLGARGKKLKELGDVIENIYGKVQHVDLGDIVDYVYYNDDKIETYTTADWIDKIVEAQW
jgi:hypothetical protein